MTDEVRLTVAVSATAVSAFSGAIAKISGAVAALLLMTSACPATIVIILGVFFTLQLTPSAERGAVGRTVQEHLADRATIAAVGGQAGLMVEKQQKKLRDFLCIICGLH